MTGDAAYVARQRRTSAAEPVAQTRLDDWFGDRRFGNGSLCDRRGLDRNVLLDGRRRLDGSGLGWRENNGGGRVRAAQVVRDARSARAA